MHRASKTFAAYGGELAEKLLAALESDRLVARFVNSYVAEFGRKGLKADASGYRELLSTLGREALLAMAAQVHAELPGYLTERRPAVLRGSQVQAAQAFFEEFLSALASALRWTPEDAEELRRDLDLYMQLGARVPLPKKHRKPTDPAEGPFVDRCALLLDPSMLENGRRAAGKFLLEIERVTQKALASVFASCRQR